MSGRFEPTPPTAQNGSWYTSQAAEAAKQVATLQSTGRPGVLHTAVIQNKSAATVFMFIFDGTATTDPLLCAPIAVAAHATVALDRRFGRPFTKGLLFAPSSSDAAFAAAAGTDLWYEVGWHEILNG